jgi:hypothetical protein
MNIGYMGPKKNKHKIMVRQFNDQEVADAATFAERMDNQIHLGNKNTRNFNPFKNNMAYLSELFMKELIDSDEGIISYEVNQVTDERESDKWDFLIRTKDKEIAIDVKARQRHYRHVVIDEKKLEKAKKNNTKLFWFNVTKDSAETVGWCYPEECTLGIMKNPRGEDLYEFPSHKLRNFDTISL